MIEIMKNETRTFVVNKELGVQRGFGTGSRPMSASTQDPRPKQ